MPQLRCSICDRAFDPEESSAAPFCSERCRLIDLHRWFDEDYGLACDPEEETEDDETGS